MSNIKVEMKRWAPEICFAASLLGLSPLLAIQCAHLWERPHFQFFPLAWAAFIVLIVTRGKIGWVSSGRRARLGMVAWGLGLATGLVAAYRFSPWMMQVAAIVCVTGWGLLRLETGSAIRWLGWTLLLWVTLPLPGRFDRELVDRLQQISSQSAGSLLDLFGVIHLRQGNLIEIRSAKLFVDEACSGIDSLYSLFAIALVMMLWQRRPLVVGLFTLASVPVWAWLGNVVRLTLIAFLLDRWQIDLSQGWKHAALGLAVFAGSSACLFVTLRAFASLFQRFSTASLPRDRKSWHLAYNAAVCFPGKAPEVRSEEDDYFASARPTPATAPARASRRGRAYDPLNGPAARRPLFVTAIVASVAIMTLGTVAIAKSRRSDLLAVPHFDAAHVNDAFIESAMPETLQGAKRVSFAKVERSPDNFNGEYSRIWKYRDTRNEFILSADFPFRGFHPLWLCYTNVGNSLEGDPVLLDPPELGSAAGDQPSIARVKLKDELGGTSYVWFSLFDASGRPVPAQEYRADASTLLVGRLLGRNGSVLEMEPVSYQFQLYLQSDDDLTDSELEHYLKVYTDALPLAIDQVRRLNSK